MLFLNLFNPFNKTLGRDVTSGYGVSSSNELAVEVGMKVLKDGGNAVDAAAAISYVLGVVNGRIEKGNDIIIEN